MMSWIDKKFVPVGNDWIIHAYGDWVSRHMDVGGQAFFLTFMFNQLPGPPTAKIEMMHDEIMRVYATLATRVVRKPSSPRWSRFLPRGIFFPDRPVFKHRKSSLRDVSVNDGLHMHGIMVVPPRTGNVTLRMRESLDDHFLRNMHLYLNERLIRIHIKPITEWPRYVTEYAGKAVKQPTFDFDHVLILPRSLSELRTRSGCRVTAPEKSSPRQNHAGLRHTDK